VSLELFDTHAHLHFPEFDTDRAEMMARARQAGVTRMLTIGTEVPTRARPSHWRSRSPACGRPWASIRTTPRRPTRTC